MWVLDIKNQLFCKTFRLSFSTARWDDCGKPHFPRWILSVENWGSSFLLVIQSRSLRRRCFTWTWNWNYITKRKSTTLTLHHIYVVLKNMEILKKNHQRVECRLCMIFEIKILLVISVLVMLMNKLVACNFACTDTIIQMEWRDDLKRRKRLWQSTTWGCKNSNFLCHKNMIWYIFSHELSKIPVNSQSWYN